MKKYYFYIALFLGFCMVSCNKIPNKPIYEELSISEIKTAMKQDSAFGEFYDMVLIEHLDQRLKPSEKAQYDKITYRRLFKYQRYISDDEMRSKKISKWMDEWNQNEEIKDSGIDMFDYVMSKNKEDIMSFDRLCYEFVNKYF